MQKKNLEVGKPPAKIWKSFKDEFSLYVDIMLAKPYEMKINIFKYLIWDWEKNYMLQPFDQFVNTTPSQTKQWKETDFSWETESKWGYWLICYWFEGTAATCNSGMGKDLLIKDRTVCSTQNSHMRESFHREKHSDLQSKRNYKNTRRIECRTSHNRLPIHELNPDTQQEEA